MAYVFSDEVLAKIKITDETDNDFTLNGINAREQSADSIRAGVSTIIDIVGWQVQEAVRIVNQDIVEDT